MYSHKYAFLSAIALKCITVQYILTPWCRVLLEKLTGLQLVKKFPAFHGTRRFITALTSVRHLSLSWSSPIQSIYPHPTSWRSILILSTHLSLGLPRPIRSKNAYWFQLAWNTVMAKTRDGMTISVGSSEPGIFHITLTAVQR